ncbi:MAG: BlaI/MecI/CopY family transcriptional regulator [Chlamydiota bacterium]
MGKLQFGELEFSIMKVVQKIGRATVRSVFEELGAGSYTTIMTVMSRMAAKKELLREKEGKQYVYWINSKNVTSSKNLLQRIQQKLFGGSKPAMVSYLLETDIELSEEDLQEIEKLIQKRRLERKHG